MSKNTISRKSATNRDALRTLQDDRIDTEGEPFDSDEPAAIAEYWQGASIIENCEAVGTTRRPGQRGPQKAPTKKRTALRIDPEVLAYFRATGSGWQTRINDVLRAYVQGRR